MTPPPAQLPAGEIQFFDAFEPGLKDGTYRVDFGQTVGAPGAAIAPASQTFVVQGPRYGLPPEDVHTMFPPAGTTGTFDGVLPHVVLTKRLLPWERDVPMLGDDVPWLALLAFGDGELLGDAAGGTYAQTLTVQQLLAPDPGQVRKPRPTTGTVSADELAGPCQAITLPSALFAQIVPTAAELPYLAHARQVNTGDKAILGMKDDGWFSVVVGSRFPPPGTAAAASRCIVHLVSLEGFGDLLGGAAPVAPGEPRIQLASLASWTFSCLADPAQTFSGLAQNLAYDATGAARPGEALRLRLPFTPSSATDAGTVAAQRRLADGYVALGYHARSGEEGFAWYRGPLVPVVTAPAPGAATFASADAAIIYDPASGVFDHSLATAWQAGRAVALSSQPYATTLVRVRRAASATLESLSAPSGGGAHARLAALVQGGGLRTVGAASATGAVAPDAPPRPRASLAAVAAGTPVARLRAVLAQPDVRARLAAQAQADPDFQTAADWLGQLLLLRPVPFVHLVPDARMLPAESIRFFYVDANWTSALLDGALGVGIGTSRESQVQAALTQQLQAAALQSALAWRANQLGQPVPPAPSGPWGGFLLRSALATGWPGLVVTASAGGAPVPLLRLEHLGAGVLVALFAGVPDTVTLSAPQEGLEFGVDDRGEVETRTLTPAPQVTVGARVHVYDPANPAAASPAVRAGGQRTLNLVGGTADLRGTLAGVLGIAPAALGPARFAMQMIKGPEQIQFSLQPPPPRPA
ncbi:MAG TPA: hypothetical protein VGB66_02785 [Longimicrobium sp.]